MGEEGFHAAMRVIGAGDVGAGATALRRAIAAGMPSLLLADAYGNLGTALTMLGRRAEGADAYRAALAARPAAGSGLTRFNLGILLAEDGRAAEAEAQYRAAVAHAPTLEGASNNLGNLLAEAGRRAEAAAAYRTAIAANPAHAMSYNNLANVLRGLASRGPSGGPGDSGGGELERAAGRAYATAIRLAPRYLEAYRNLGNLLKERAPWRPHAVAAYRAALSLAPAERPLLLNLGETLQWLGRHAAANATFALAVERGVWRHPQQRPSSYDPRLRAAPWWAPAEVPAVRRALAGPGLGALREEGLALLREGSSALLPYHSPALRAGNWSDVTLALSGMRQPGAAHAPRSYALYESLGEDATSMVSGAAYFSVLSPGARLQPHCGPTNVRLRVHVGLAIPPGAALRVGNETRPWRDGEVLVFDDSFEHEVWNDGPSPRLVFIFDVWHPQLDTDEARLAALDATGQQRYRTTTDSLRAGRGLPVAAQDLVAERRVRTIY